MHVLDAVVFLELFPDGKGRKFQGHREHFDEFHLPRFRLLCGIHIREKSRRNPQSPQAEETTVPTRSILGAVFCATRR